MAMEVEVQAAATRSPSEEESFQGALRYALRMLRKENLLLKSEQLKAIESVYRGEDIFLLLPTGYGKSICFECLPFLFDYKLRLNTLPRKEWTSILVVSPLISLMVNQVKSLKQRGVSAAILSENPGVDKDMQALSVLPGQYSLLYTAPEAVIDNDKWRQCMLDLGGKIVCIVVDEAHCVSRWSRHFRHAYSRVGELRGIVPSNTPWFACTATATHVVREDVCKLLDMVGCKVVSLSPNRPNIYYEVFKRTTIEQDFQPLVEEILENGIKTSRVIVYFKSLNLCADIIYTLHH